MVLGQRTSIRRLDATIVERRFAAWEWSAIVGDEHDERVVGDLLSIEFVEYLANVFVESANLVVVQCEVVTHLRRVGNEWRQARHRPHHVAVAIVFF